MSVSTYLACGVLLSKKVSSIKANADYLALTNPLEYLLTSSLYSGAELSGDLLDILKRTPSQPSATVSERPPVLQVLFECALYLIPLDECDSWFVCLPLADVCSE